jgi:Helix-turn-helix domain
MTDMTEPIPEHMKRAPDLQFLTPEQVADRLGMSLCTLRDLRRRGGGPSSRRTAGARRIAPRA